MTDPRFGFCEQCYRLVELEVGGALTEHYRYISRSGEMVYSRELCPWSGCDPAPLPVEEDLL